MERTENPVGTKSTANRKRIHSIVYTALEKGSSFSLWRLPNHTDVNLIISSAVHRLADVNLEDSQPGFIIAPFDSQQDKYFLSAQEHYKIGPDTITRNGNDFEFRGESFASPDAPIKFHYSASSSPRSKEVDSAPFVSLVQKSIAAIDGGLFEKVVPSRCKSFPHQAGTDWLSNFDRLCEQYPNALITLISTPETGTWLGATPELLVRIDPNQIFHTVALAGTQRYEVGMDPKQISWTQKDIEEQALVSRYVINCFKKIRLREFDEHGPKSALAGNVIHLKTEFHADMIATNFPQLGSVMLQLLHPTSAVCGMPLETAQTFLRESEGYDRQLYAGYWGPVQIEQETNIYVNLRCMQIFPREAMLYAGAGVTIDSIPEKEWEETEMKMNTLLQVIQF
jgi:isochorismate synthase